MSILKRVVPITVALCFFAGHAKDPATLVQQFNDALPAGTEARMVWGQVNGTNNELWGVDSREGIPRKIDVGTADVMNPQLTYDATRVVFHNALSGKVHVVNWNGTGLTSGISAGGRIEDYWRDPNGGSEHVLMYDGGYYKLNIATGAKVNVCGGGDDGARLSLDGMRMAVYTEAGNPVTLSVSGCQQMSSESCSDCGCVVNIAPDNTYRIMRQISGHTQLKITGSGPITGTVTIVTSTAGGILAVNTGRNTCTDNTPQFEESRWVHPEVVTFFMDNMNDNPYLFNLSSKKWVSIQESIGTDKVNCPNIRQSADAIISSSLPGLTSVAQNRVRPLGFAGYRGSETLRGYAIDGRLLDAANLHSVGDRASGLVIQQSRVNGVFTVTAVVR